MTDAPARGFEGRADDEDHSECWDSIRMLGNIASFANPRRSWFDLDSQAAVELTFLRTCCADEYAALLT